MKLKEDEIKSLTRINPQKPSPNRGEKNKHSSSRFPWQIPPNTNITLKLIILQQHFHKREEEESTSKLILQDQDSPL